VTAFFALGSVFVSGVLLFICLWALLSDTNEWMNKSLDAFNPSLRVTPIRISQRGCSHKLEWWSYQVVNNLENMFNRFDTIPDQDRHLDSLDHARFCLQYKLIHRAGKCWDNVFFHHIFVQDLIISFSYSQSLFKCKLAWNVFSYCCWLAWFHSH